MDNHYYHCDYCNQEYRLQTTYNNHVAFCEFAHKSRREQEEELDAYETIPTQKEMYLLLKTLVCRVTKLEKENSKLRQFALKENKKIDILEWLNQRKDQPSLSFREWILQFSYRDCVSCALEKDMSTAIVNAFENGSGGDCDLKNMEVIPIRVFLQKKNLFYVYNKHHSSDLSPSWYILTDELFDKWIDYIVTRILGEFGDWFEQQLSETPRQRAVLEENKNYYYQKLFCTKQCEETRNKRVRQCIYKILQKQSKGVAEYAAVEK